MMQISRAFRYAFWWEREWNFEREPKEDGFKNVIFLDIDGLLNNENENTDRGEYIIEEYVANLGERTGVEHFVILDDDDFWHWDWLMPFFVCTKDKANDQILGCYGKRLFEKSRKGFTRDKLEKALIVLNSEM